MHEENHRKLLFVTYACIALVGIMAVIKANEKGFFTELVHPQVSQEADFVDSDSLKVDEAFFVTPTGTVNAQIDNATNSPVVVYSGPKAYIVGRLDTGEIVLKKNENRILPVASMSKLVTAIAALDTMKKDVMIEITPLETNVASDTSMLMSGEKFTMGELLYPLLLSSSNVAAEALASTTNRIEFLELMSSYAWEVGMPSTYFADPSGISSKNESTAKDFFALASYLFKSRPDILSITKTAKSFIATSSDHGSHKVINIHPFVNDPDFLGGKTGRTPEAGETMLTIMSIDGKPVAIVILGSEVGRREADTKVLIDEYKSVIASDNK